VTILLAIGAGLCVVGGVVLVFARDWVWSVDQRADGHPRDENGEPIRTKTWDRNHLLLGWVMLLVGAGLGAWVLLG